MKVKKERYYQSMYLGPKLQKQLRALAGRYKTTMAYIVRLCLDKHLDDVESKLTLLEGREHVGTKPEQIDPTG